MIQRSRRRAARRTTPLPAPGQPTLHQYSWASRRCAALAAVSGALVGDVTNVVWIDTLRSTPRDVNKFRKWRFEPREPPPIPQTASPLTDRRSTPGCSQERSARRNRAGNCRSSFPALRGHEPAARLGELLLHVKAREFAEDPLHLLGGDQLDAEPAIVEPDAHRPHGDFRLLVKRDRWC